MAKRKMVNPYSIEEIKKEIGNPIFKGYYIDNQATEGIAVSTGAVQSVLNGSWCFLTRDHFSLRH